MPFSLANPEKKKHLKTCIKYENKKRFLHTIRHAWFVSSLAVLVHIVSVKINIITDDFHNKVMTLNVRITSLILHQFG